MDELLWSLLGFVVFPLWLLAGLVDFGLHRRTDIAHTAGLPESRLHLIQALHVGIAVLVVLFVELDLLALAILVAAAVAHTITAYWDVHYASQRRVILPLEQTVHAFLFTLPLFATALVVILHWPAVLAPTVGEPGAWGLRWREQPWDVRVIVAVLVASGIFGLLPALIEYRHTKRVDDLAPSHAST